MILVKPIAKFNDHSRLNVNIFVRNFASSCEFPDSWGILKSGVVEGEQPAVVLLGEAVLDRSAAEVVLGLRFGEPDASTLSSDIHCLRAVELDVHVALMHVVASLFALCQC